MRSYIDQRHGLVYLYDKREDTVTALAADGSTTIERVSRSLVERLEAQGVPSVLWRGSRKINTLKSHCPWCGDTGQAYGGECICCE